MYPKVTITPIELLALEKLAIIGHTLANQLTSGTANDEMSALVGVLDKVIARAKSGE